MPTRFTAMVEELCDIILADVVDCVPETRAYYIHPLTSIYAYMTSAAGGDPFICADCDYKTTINKLFLDHRNFVTGHSGYTVSVNGTAVSLISFRIGSCILLSSNWWFIRTHNTGDFSLRTSVS